MASDKIEQPDQKSEVLKPPMCGLVMPISALDGCNEQHWLEVREILCDAISNAGFEPNLVSNADDVGIIQKRIIQNLYSNPIVVCDVSGKNPNVMFELGMRLAFDKPTIIIKDDKTSYSFDTSPIEHIEYPRDLRFNRVVDFKNGLKDKLKATYKKSTEDVNYTTFLKNFGKFTVAKLETAELSKDEFLLEEMAEIRKQMQYMVSKGRPYSQKPSSDRPVHLGQHECIQNIADAIRTIQGIMIENGMKRRAYSTRAVLEKAKDLNVFPTCFNENNTTCIEMVEKILEGTRTGQSTLEHEGSLIDLQR